MTESLNKKIRNWLVKQGYPLEMEMASQAKELGFDVSQSDYYIDPENKEAREIDLVLCNTKFLSGVSLSYNLLIECKSGTEKPWLLLANPNKFDCKETIKEKINHTSIYSSYIANNYAEEAFSDLYYSDKISKFYPRIDTEPSLGYGLTQAFTNGTDVPFKAMMSATKASFSHIERFGRSLLNFSKTFTIAIPVVVIEAPLYSIVYNSNSSEFEINQIPYGTLLWKHVVAHRSRIGVFIVQRSYLKIFLKQCKSCSDWWCNLDESYLKEIAGRIESRYTK